MLYRKSIKCYFLLYALVAVEYDLFDEVMTFTLLVTPEMIEPNSAIGLKVPFEDEITIL